MKRGAICWILILLGWLAAAEAQLTVFYLRHAEGGHNVVDQFVKAGIPTNEWPAYVGNENAFSPQGEAQAQATATNLLAYRFDFIAVSPKWRTRHTILPYLQATGQKAEIWPELGETANTDQLPAAGGLNPELWHGARSIRLTPEETNYFTFRADGTGRRELVVSNQVEAVACARRVEQLLHERFQSQPAHVLLVGHGNASRTLLRSWTRQPDLNLPHMKNVHLWAATERAEGGLVLDFYNERPGRPVNDSVDHP